MARSREGATGEDGLSGGRLPAQSGDGGDGRRSTATLAVLGWAGLVIGGAMVLVGLIIGGGLYPTHGLTIPEILLRATVLVGGGALAMGGRRALARRRGRLAPSLTASLAADPRPPVLYLRSFENDEDASRFGELPQEHFLSARGLAGLFSLRTEEEQIGRAFSAVGPFVAVGKPDEVGQGPRAPRRSFSDEDWRAGVADLIGKSARVVLRAGFGAGLRWEIEKTVELVEPTRVILLVPFGMAKYEAFVRFASPLFPRGLPEQTLPRIPLPNFSGVVLFDAAWSPRFVPLRMPVGAFAVVERALRRAIERGKPGRPPSERQKRALAAGVQSSSDGALFTTAKEFSFHLDGPRQKQLRLLTERTEPAIDSGREWLEVYLDGVRIGPRLDVGQVVDGHELALPDGSALRIQRAGKGFAIWVDGQPIRRS
jgi:hypothetical protein